MQHRATKIDVTAQQSERLTRAQHYIEHQRIGDLLIKVFAVASCMSGLCLGPPSFLWCGNYQSLEGGAVILAPCGEKARLGDCQRDNVFIIDFIQTWRYNIIVRTIILVVIGLRDVKYTFNYRRRRILRKTNGNEGTAVLVVCRRVRR